jgi:thiamine-phosphate pyrophosphorylase
VTGHDSPCTIQDSRFVVSPFNPIVDVDGCAHAGCAPLDLLRACLDAGATFIQLRAKRLASGPFLDLADAAVTLAAPYDGRIVVNDRADVARLAGAAGVHVGQEDLPPAAARRVVGAAAIVGYSTHTVAQAEAGLREPVTYIAVGPVFGTRTKDTGYAAVGLDLVRTVSRMAGPIPVVAIGGITLDNAGAVLDAGATAVAVIGDLLTTGDPGARAAAYLRVLARHRV